MINKYIVYLQKTNLVADRKKNAIKEQSYLKVQYCRKNSLFIV